MAVPLYTEVRFYCRIRLIINSGRNEDGCRMFVWNMAGCHNSSVDISNLQHVVFSLHLILSLYLLGSLVSSLSAVGTLNLTDVTFEL